MKKILKRLIPFALCACALLCGAACTEDEAGETITEMPKESVEEQKLSLDRTSLMVTVGDETKLKASYSEKSGTSLVWSSSAGSVATVDNGTVVAVAPGTAIITATYGDESVSCTVSVGLGGYLPSMTFELPENETLVTSLSQTINMKPTAFFNGKYFDDVMVRYVVENEDVGAVNAQTGEFIPKKAGETTVTVYANWRGIGEEMSREFAVRVHTTKLFLGGFQDELIYISDSFMGKEYKNFTHFSVVTKEEGEEKPNTVTVLEGADVIKYDSATKEVTPLSIGTAKIRVAFDSSEGVIYKDFSITVECPIYEVAESYRFSAVNGKFYDEDNKTLKSISELYDNYGETLYRAVINGEELNVSEGSVYGLENYLIDLTTYTNVQILAYNSNGALKLNLDVASAIITSVSEFEAFAETTDKYGYYVLENDIDLNGVDLYLDETKSGDLYNSSIQFSGVFDGKGHTVKNIVFHEKHGYNGIFGVVKANSVIQNVAFLNAQFPNTKGYCAVLGKKLEKNTCIVENVYVQVTKGSDTGHNHGALFAGELYYGTFKNVVVEYPDYETAPTLKTSFGSIASVGADYVGTMQNVYLITKTKPLGVNAGYKTFDECRILLTEGDRNAFPEVGAGPYGNGSNKYVDNNRRYIITGVTRYDNFMQMKEAEESYTQFDSTYWDYSKGILLWHSLADIADFMLSTENINADAYCDSKGVVHFVGNDKFNGFSVYNESGTLIGTVNNGVVDSKGLFNLAVGDTGVLLLKSATKSYKSTYKKVTSVITNEEEFKAFAETQTKNGYFVLSADLDLTGVDLVLDALYSGNLTETNYSLTGTFDGLGHTISNLTFDEKHGYNGIFGIVNKDSVIRNVAFKNVKLAQDERLYCAVLGKHMNANSCLVENVYVQVTQGSVNGKNRAALFCGQLYYGTLKNVVVEYPNYESEPAYNSPYGTIAAVGADFVGKMENVYVISKTKPLSCNSGYKTPEEYRIWFTQGDKTAFAQCGSGPYGSGTNKYVDNNRRYIITGVTRYDNYDAMKSASNDYSSFTATEFWSVKENMLVWGA